MVFLSITGSCIEWNGLKLLISRVTCFEWDLICLGVFFGKTKPPARKDFSDVRANLLELDEKMKSCSMAESALLGMGEPQLWPQLTTLIITVIE